ncbi:BTAD domain-containing putative transcriptional regulator [Micromonospora sp. NPDC049101]|uniref:AfsR/SARP family transcriptional regulator n=1 Tax=unclassified Micromonospora TaxID=2617518 RepID=UPI0033DC0BC8
MADHVLVRILGPVELAVNGRSLDVGPRQRQAVLAALAVDAGTPVSIDALAERVWGDDAPDAPRSAIYAHIARLRRVLGVSADVRTVQLGLSRHGAGYRLDVDRRVVDLHRFRWLIETSRHAEDSADRILMLREALDLWRGEPLPVLGGEWAARTRAGIQSQYIGASAAWAAEELRLANPEPVVDRLTQLAGSHPLAEPLVALLMRALCAVGRTAEALRCYADTREQLADRLGAEPGPELRELHVAILRGELGEAPGGLAPAREPSLGPEPRQLPADLSRFTGRVRELVRVSEWFAADRPDGAATVLAIHGPAGVGKSALAIHAAHRLSRRYPDGQLYLDLRGSSLDLPPLEPAEGLARLLRALGVPASSVPAQADEAAVMFRSVVAAKRLLLVLDNAVEATQVRPLLPGVADCATLVTSRRALVGLGDIGQVHLGPLSVAEGVRLLGRWINDDRLSAEPEAAAAIARRCEGLPVALSAAGARLSARPAWPLAELAGRLRDPDRRLDNLEFDGVGVRASLAACWQQLTLSADPTERAAADAFTLLAAAGVAEFDNASAGVAEFDNASAARLLQRPVAVAERLLERLVDARLLESALPGRYRMGGLLGLYARERLVGRHGCGVEEGQTGARLPAGDPLAAADTVGVWAGRGGALWDI